MERTDMKKAAVWAAVFLVVSVLSAGCTAHVRYLPALAAHPSEVNKWVQLRVVDARAAKRGVGDGRRVGNVRGGFGNPFKFVQGKRDATVDQLVAASIEDALAKSGIGVKPDARCVLTARVLRFWTDGYTDYDYEANVDVEYQLVDDKGNPLWTGSAGGTADKIVIVWSTNQQSRLVEAALSQEAREAAALFLAQGVVAKVP